MPSVRVAAISVPEALFKGILDGAARGFTQHGFRDIVLLGDSDNYQDALKAVAAGLNRDRGVSGARALDRRPSFGDSGKNRKQESACEKSPFILLSPAASRVLRLCGGGLRHSDQIHIADCWRWFCVPPACRVVESPTAGETDRPG